MCSDPVIGQRSLSILSFGLTAGGTGPPKDRPRQVLLKFPSRITFVQSGDCTSFRAQEKKRKRMRERNRHVTESRRGRPD